MWLFERGTVRVNAAAPAAAAFCIFFQCHASKFLRIGSFSFLLLRLFHICFVVVVCFFLFFFFASALSKYLLLLCLCPSVLYLVLFIICEWFFLGPSLSLSSRLPSFPRWRGDVYLFSLFFSLSFPEWVESAG
jgi:hypothetical protein